ncbi:MAG: ABC transporter permease subunit [Actinomycetota bacterium]|nr:MAG: ABC transporter permease subunit [Actinomycetota bacterium]
MTVILKKENASEDTFTAAKDRVTASGRRFSLSPPGAVYALIVILILWQVIGSMLDPIYISTPVLVYKDLFSMLFGKHQIWHDIAVSAVEMYVGLGIALVLGGALGLLIGRSKVARSTLAPYINFLNATPIVITLPLMAIWVGVNQKARIIFIVILALWPVLLNVAAGCRNVSGRYTELGSSAGLTRSEMIRKIIVPGVLPYFLTGARISAGLVVIGVVVSEMEVSLVGLGYLLASYASGFQTAKLLAVFVISTTFGLVNVGVLTLIARKWAPWVATEKRGR